MAASTATGLAERREFQSEHLRLMQALLESIEKQCTLHQQLRGLKESLVSTAVRLHVATRVAEEDGSSMAQLRQEALQAKRRSLEAEKKANNASDLIMNLNNEILNLKKSLREAGIDTQRATLIAETAPLTQQDMDYEVDDMVARFQQHDLTDDAATDNYGATTLRPTFFDRSQTTPASAGIATAPSSSSRSGKDGGIAIHSMFAATEGGALIRPFSSNNLPEQGGGMPPIDHGFSQAKRPTTAGGDAPRVMFSRPTTSDGGYAGTSRPTSRGPTPFQQWKTDRLVWSPDTAAGSEFVDQEAADVVAQLDGLEMFRDGVSRTTRSRAGKVKAKVFDTTAIAAEIATATKKVTRLPSVELAMANAALAAAETSGGRQNFTQTAALGATVQTARGPDGKPLSKYHYDRDRFASKQAGSGDIDKGENARVTSKLFTPAPSSRGLAR